MPSIAKIGIGLFGILITASLISYFGIKYTYDPTKIPKIDTVQVYNDNFEIELVKADLDTYGTISPKVERIIIDNILDVHKKYNIPIGLLHCIFRVESEYRFNIDHPTVQVVVHKNQIKTHAIGLGGVMWCFWGDSLKKAGIADMETDLYLPDVNIQASGFILHSIIQSILNSIKGYPLGILTEIVRRYYGAYNTLYMSKMQKITSDLWMKRMAKAILQTSYRK